MPDNDPMTQQDQQALIAQMLLEERAEKRQAELNKRRAKEAALAQQKATERDKSAKESRFQSVCDHLQGNHPVGVIPDVKRSALHRDEFCDKSVRIWCQKCHMEWKPGDTQEHLVRDGAKRANPTGQSWKDINKFFFTFQNAKELMSRQYRVEQIAEPVYE